MKESIGIPGGVASLDGNGNVPTSQLGNVDVDIFMIVNELPTENIKNNKIYCVRDTTSTDENNTYIEYAYINNKWEKVGEFQTKPNLSGYAKLDGAFFDGFIYASNGFYCNFINKTAVGKYLMSTQPEDRDVRKTYNAYGTITDVGEQEDFIFTLEDGSTVTKSIRVISTTSQAGA